MLMFKSKFFLSALLALAICPYWFSSAYADDCRLGSRENGPSSGAAELICQKTDGQSQQEAKSGNLANKASSNANKSRSGKGGKRQAKPGSKPGVKSHQVGAAAEIERGKVLYKANECAACHKIAGQGCEEGVVLDQIGKKRSFKFICEHLKDPDDHVSKNKEAFGGDPVNLMPALHLTDSEIKLIARYLQSLK